MANNLGDVLTRFWNACYSQLPPWVFCFWTIALLFMFFFLFLMLRHFNTVKNKIPPTSETKRGWPLTPCGLFSACLCLKTIDWSPCSVVCNRWHAPTWATGIDFCTLSFAFFLLITGIVSKKVWPILKRHPYPERLLRLLKCHNLVNNDKAFRLLFTTKKNNVTKAWFSLSDKTPLLFITRDCEELSSFQLTGNVTGSLTAQSRNSPQDSWQIWCGRSLSPKKAGRDF